MEEIQELMGELPMIDLSEYRWSGISAGTVTSLIAAVFLIILIGRGYQRGAIVEISGVVALLASFVALIVVKPFLGALLPAAWGRIPRAILYILLCYLVYRVVKYLLRALGDAFRKIPLIGWIVGVLGGIFGCVRAVLMILIFQHATGINVTGAVAETVNKLPFV